MSCLQETPSNLLSCLQVVQWALFPGSMSIIPVGCWEVDLIMRLSLSYFYVCKQILTHILLRNPNTTHWFTHKIELWWYTYFGLSLVSYLG